MARQQEQEQEQEQSVPVEQERGQNRPPNDGLLQRFFGCKNSRSTLQ
jgi:hypothetical protein